MTSQSFSLPFIPAKNKHSLLLTLRDYYENIGQYLPNKKLERTPIAQFNYGEKMPQSISYNEIKLWQVDQEDHSFFYGVTTNKFASNLPKFTYNNCGAALAVYAGEGNYGAHIEQLYVADYDSPRLFSRCGYTTEKEAWVETVTEANIDRFAPPVGVPLPWPKSKPPVGYLECNGADIDAEKYPKLAYAYWDRKLPDLRNWDNSRNKDRPDSKNITFMYIVKAE